MAVNVLTFHVDSGLLFVHIHLKFSVSSDLFKESDGLSHTTEHTVLHTHALHQQYKIIHTQYKFSSFFLHFNLPYFSIDNARLMYNAHDAN